MLFAIDNYENYSISKEGKIFSIKKELTLEKTYDGYLRTALYKNNIKTRFLVHRLVALTFIPNPKKKTMVNHINGIKTDNRVENLEWVTASENCAHAVKIGLSNFAVGESFQRSHLKDEDIKQIRLLKTNGHSNAELSLIFNTSRQNIYHIVSYNSWRHLK